ncbi:hypothetical protein Tsp_10114 [Trichinella spiralis]|uniref:hypothetical protein n=1 Tax=Trichinella spiralis TaxID=6334 RepID=UPI0001EFB386|nr:hypothetical protein Tsp_10114 [Trichinella spiralis]
MQNTCTRDFTVLIKKETATKILLLEMAVYIHIQKAVRIQQKDKKCLTYMLCPVLCTAIIMYSIHEAQANTGVTFSVVRCFSGPQLLSGFNPLQLTSSGFSGCAPRCATTIRTTGATTALSYYYFGGALHGSIYRAPGSAARRVVQSNCQWATCSTWERSISEAPI